MQLQLHYIDYYLLNFTRPTQPAIYYHPSTHLIKNGSVGTQKVEHGSGVQTPVPHLTPRLNVRVVAGKSIRTGEGEIPGNGVIGWIVHIRFVAIDLLLIREREKGIDKIT